jgi:hypothetical protein
MFGGKDIKLQTPTDLWNLLQMGKGVKPWPINHSLTLLCTFNDAKMMQKWAN